MQSSYHVHINAAEWRWVTSVSVVLLLLALMPFLVVLLRNDGQWQFMGMIGINYRDGGSYLSKIRQGVEGEWGIQFRHTPEEHFPSLIQTLYPLMGHIARFGSLSTVVVFHLMRICASLFMYFAIYQLGATVWSRVRTRRIFFALAVIGGGFGWLLGPLTGDNSYPDLALPEAYPFLSSFVNVHFPLTLACLALLASTYILALRQGHEQDPNLTNGGLAAFMLTVLLGILYPQALLPFAGGLTAYIGLIWLRSRRIVPYLFWWWLVLALPSLVFFAYYIGITMTNPVLTLWNTQNATLAPHPLVLLLGLGLPLLIAVPALGRAATRLEQDGDQLVLLWLVVLLVAMYLPTNVQRRFAVGMMLLVAYFATRSVEDFWLKLISRTVRNWLYIILLPLLSFSALFVMLASSLGSSGLLRRDYASAFAWLDENTDSRTVVLASYEVSNWLPGWAGVRTVNGHPYETLLVEEKEAAVIAWYSDPQVDCAALLNGAHAFNNQSYQIDYILVGPEERSLGSDREVIESTCLDSLTTIAIFGEVTVYAR
jgi:hypothetical protein